MVIINFGLVLIFISLVLGHFVTNYLLEKVMRTKWAEWDDPDNKEPFIPAWFIGILERVFFTFLVAFNVSGTAIAMIGWMTLKLTRNVSRFIKDTKPAEKQHMFSGILGTMISLFFALIGGLIIRFYVIGC